MKFKCEKCGEEFDTYSEAMDHEVNIHINESLTVEDRLKAIEAAINGLNKSMNNLISDMASLRVLIMALPQTHTTPTFPLPQYPQYITCDTWPPKEYIVTNGTKDTAK